MFWPRGGASAGAPAEFPAAVRAPGGRGRGAGAGQGWGGEQAQGHGEGAHGYSLPWLGEKE